MEVGEPIHMNAHELLAQAFHDDPFLTWAEPDPIRRPRTLSALFAGMLAYSRRVGGVFYQQDAGVVDWRDAASAHIGPWDILASGTWRIATVAPPAVWSRLSAHEDQAMQCVKRFLKPGSVYLASLGVNPTLAGQGWGGRLLQQALSRQAARWSTCVLRTEQPRNLPFYTKHGFTQVDECVIEVSNLRMWVFARPLTA